MVGFNLIRQQMQYFFINLARVLAYMQKIMIIRFKAGYKNPFFVHPEFTTFSAVMRMLAHLKMMYFLILADR